jgi:beta-glucanase (GH16 family)
MKTILSLLTASALVLHGALPAAPAGWKLVWNDEFEQTNRIDSKKWSPCERGTSDWNNFMTRDPRCYSVKDGMLHLIGILNNGKDKDKVPYLTGGVTTLSKFEFKHGKIAIRARFKSAKGAWPALWLLGVEGGWPANGEIDLMEHLNFDKSVYQTVHSNYTLKIDKSNTPPKGGTAAIDVDDFNTYGAEWDADKIVFTVNGKPSHTYPRVPDKGPEQWPFDQPFYIIMSMQIEGSWVGKADPDDYPAGMEIDWVRVYSKA